MSRASTSFFFILSKQDVDGRDKPGHDGGERVDHYESLCGMGEPFTLRLYEPGDEDAAIELWRRTWQQHYPQIDFAARVPWWRERWRNELVSTAIIILAAN